MAIHLPRWCLSNIGIDGVVETILMTDKLLKRRLGDVRVSYELVVAL